MATWHIQRAADRVAVPWRNGLGLTRDVVTMQDETGALRWQVSIADLVQDAAFSHFPHCDRVFTPIAGDPPPELAFHGGPFEPCPLLVPKPFPGDVPTSSRIPAPGRAFNAIVDRRHHTLAVTVHPDMHGPLTLPEAAGLVVYCHAGTMDVAGTRLEPGDSLVTAGPRPPIAANGTLLLVAVR